MAGHEDTQVVAAADLFVPGAPADEPDGSLPAPIPTAEELELAERAAEIVLGQVQPLIVTITDTLGERVDALEKRFVELGMGGETVGDALAVARYGLACARAVASVVERGVGLSVPLPPAPEFTGVLAEPTVVGAETVDIV